jgi:predicted transcriptional regulator
MKTLKIRIESLDEVEAAITEAVRSGRGETEAGLSFTSYDDMHRILSPRRLEIVRAMAGRGAISMREVARLVGRDFKSVHGDVTALVKAGVLDREERGVAFPYEGIHVEFDIKAAA